MKNSKLTKKQLLKTLTLGLVFSSSLAMAAPDPLADLNSPAPASEAKAPQTDKNQAVYQDILNLIQNNKLKEAESKISALLAATPSIEAYNLQGLLKIQQKDNAAAQKSYEKALQLDSKNVFAYLGLLKIAADAGQLDKAKDYANKVIAINDKAIGAYLALAEIANKQKDIKEMERVLVLALEKAKGSEQAEIEVFKVIGQVYAATKQADKILPIAQDIAKRYPNNGIAVNLLAQAQIVNNDKPGAEKTLTSFVAQNKQDAGNRLFLAKILMEQQNKKAEIIALLDEAAKLTPDNPEALATKTAYLIKINETTEALALADKIDKQYPALIVGKLLKGDAYLAEKKLDKTLEIYQQIYKIEPNERVLFTMVDLMAAQKQGPAAIALLEKEVTKSSKSLDIRFKLAALYAQQDDSKHAEEQYKAILAKDPGNVLALNNMAFLYARNNDPKALEFAKKAYSKAPNEPAVADTYGSILLMQGNAKEGLVVLEKAAKATPKASDIQFHLAIAYAKTDNKKKAIEILEGITKEPQDSPQKAAAVKMLGELKAK